MIDLEENKKQILRNMKFSFAQNFCISALPEFCRDYWPDLSADCFYTIWMAQGCHDFGWRLPYNLTMAENATLQALNVG